MCYSNLFIQIVAVIKVPIACIICYYIVNSAVKMGDTTNCVFCKIIDGTTNEEKLFENDKFIIISDIRPESDFHFLAIPRVHIPDGRSLNRTHIDLGI